MGSSPERNHDSRGNGHHYGELLKGMVLGLGTALVHRIFSQENATALAEWLRDKAMRRLKDAATRRDQESGTRQDDSTATNTAADVTSSTDPTAASTAVPVLPAIDHLGDVHK